MDIQQQVAISDPWDSAENPTFQTPQTWGSCSVDMYFCILVKGTGKVKFDSQVHKIDQRRTAIDIVVTPLVDMNSQFNTVRSMIAEGKEWAGVVLPSIKALGISPRELNGKFVRVSFKSTGRTYQNAAGETKDATTIIFEKVFASEAECIADYQATKGGDPAPIVTHAPVPNGTDKERNTALQFLKVIVENASRGQTDLNTIRNTVMVKISEMSLVSKYFTVDSPETVNFITEVLTK